MELLIETSKVFRALLDKANTSLFMKISGWDLQEL